VTGSDAPAGHTDYAGGRSLVCAVERGFVVAAAPRRDARVTLFELASGERGEAALDPSCEPPDRHWLRYPAVVARRLARNFPAARRGADLVFESDLPPAAGLASSSAFMIAVFLALAEVNELPREATWRRALATKEELAAYLAVWSSLPPLVPTPPSPASDPNVAPFSTAAR
jgi:galactokinase